ncbi:hypothetical protein JCM8547_000039 [Rhodosporidiobolus lusitaniae]
MPFLTDLPPELIEEICELVYKADKKQYRGSVSKHFVLTSRRLVFSKIMIWTYKRLEQLCTVVKEDPAVGSYVKKLDLELTNAVVTGRPGADSLFCLFDRLTSLTKLSVKGSHKVAGLLLDPPTSGQPLPALATLFLEDSLVGDPFDPSRFVALLRYPSLSSLAIISTSRHQELHPAYLPSPNRPRLALKRLELHGLLGKNTAL